MKKLLYILVYTVASLMGYVYWRNKKAWPCENVGFLPILLGGPIVWLSKFIVTLQDHE